jgi:hypothetical protein
MDKKKSKQTYSLKVDIELQDGSASQFRALLWEDNTFIFGSLCSVASAFTRENSVRGGHLQYAYTVTLDLSTPLMAFHILVNVSTIQDFLECPDACSLNINPAHYCNSKPVLSLLSLIESVECDIKRFIKLEPRCRADGRGRQKFTACSLGL